MGIRLKSKVRVFQSNHIGSKRLRIKFPNQCRDRYQFIIPMRIVVFISFFSFCEFPNFSSARLLFFMYPPLDRGVLSLVYIHIGKSCIEFDFVVIRVGICGIHILDNINHILVEINKVFLVFILSRLTSHNQFRGGVVG